MKQLFSFFTLTLFTIALTAQGVTMMPEKPVPGEKVKFTYDPAGTPLEDTKDFSATVIMIEDGKWEVQEVSLEYNGKNFTGKIPTNENTKAVLFSFSNPDGDKVDANDDKGYKVKMYNAERTQPAMGVYAALARGYGSYASNANIPRDQERSMKYYNKEFKYYPESKENKDVLISYAYAAARMKDKAAKEDLKGIAQKITADKKANEEELYKAYYIYQAYEMEEDATATADRIKKKNPKSEIARSEMVNKFYKERDLAAKEELFKDIKKKFAKEENTDQVLANLAPALASMHGNEGNWEKFDHYFAMIDGNQRKAGVLNSLAWAMSGESLEAEANNPEKGAELSKKSLDLLQKDMDDPAGSKPVYYTKKRWESALKSSYGMYADTYALLLWKQGKKEKALKYQTIACESRDFSDGELNERYAAYFVEVKDKKEAEKFLAKAIRKGNATSKMKEMHKEVFLQNNTLEDAYGAYVAELESEARDHYREKLAKKMMDEKAPDFTLVNLDGEKVSMSDMKGKTVILDFWATWCGPCVASFPGMQKAVNKYQDNEEVVFLFIDTWESAKDKEKNARDFIEKNSYTFNVLMDNESEVIAKYKVEGIPTKFIVDGEGKIRFKSVGFNGNDEELVTELEMMIEMTQQPDIKAVP